MSVKLFVLRPITDGTGTHKVGSYFDCEENEAARLIRMNAATIPVMSKKKPVPEIEGDEFIPENETSLPEDESEFMTEAEYEQILNDLQEVDGINLAIAERLVDAGMQTLEDISVASEKDLLQIEGIGNKSVKKIMASVEKLLLM